MYLRVAISPDIQVGSEHCTITPIKLEHALLWSHLLKEIQQSQLLQFSIFSSTGYPSVFGGQIQCGITLVHISVDQQQYN